ncbi:G-protein-signaling modulator 2-like [Oppia nitens]|uniref:G-protein-signaling modulator 2-like n=1 Tax=Oppia nitens TaxID=1686743 RepID=UPI0023DC2582|nr:G-protein-signaling modulator 2-like [Oppia nitens]
MDASTCIELAIEGERLSKLGDFNGSVAFFEAAVKCGTNDLKTLSAIYSQLGNAYFYLGNYHKAMDYHKMDLTVAKSINDRIGEAKASGNLGNSLKMMGRFDDAIIFCKRHLEISRELADKVGEGRALYNLGNVFHTKGKTMAKAGNEDPGEFPDDVKQCLEQAVDYYKQNLDLMTQLGDKSAQGRACGNLGNTHYLLGNFAQAVAYHEERLNIAKEFGDKAAERRAQCNLGNAHIFLGQFETAVYNYKQTLELAEQLKDRVVEAQACYSLGNTYTLLRDYNSAIEYHLRHLKIAQELRDRIGEGRAYWSLGNAMTAVGDHQEALNYAQKHLEISREIGDITGQTTAQMSISDLRKLLEKDMANKTIIQSDIIGRHKRLSMERMDVMALSPQQRKLSLNTVEEVVVNTTTTSSGVVVVETDQPIDNIVSSTSTDFISKSHEDFLDLVSKFQSKRMDDQRCPLMGAAAIIENKENRKPICGQPIAANSRQYASSGCSANAGNNGGGGPGGAHNARINHSVANNNAMNTNNNTTNNNNHIGRVGQSASQDSQQSSSSADHFHDLIEMIAGMQERRMDDQRAALPPQPAVRRNSATNGPESLPQQRNHTSYVHQNNENGGAGNELGGPAAAARLRPNNVANARRTAPNRQYSLGANVLPDDDFFEMLMRCQDSRLEDQRTLMPSTSSDDNTGGGGATLDRPSTLERPQSVVSTSSNSPQQSVAPTVPDEDFFSLILRFQAGRIEDQRSSLPDRQSDDDPMKSSSRKSSTASSSTTKSSSVATNTTTVTTNAPSARKSSKTQV